MKNKFTSLVALCSVFLMTSQAATTIQAEESKEANYRYHNVVSEKNTTELKEALEEQGMPSENWKTLTRFIDQYQEANKSYEKVAEDWTDMAIGKDASTFTTTMDVDKYKEQLSHFPDDLNCRQTAFLLLRSLVSYDKDKLEQLPVHEEFKALSKLQEGLTDEEGQLYSLLFNDNKDYKSTDDLTKAWEDAGVKFSDKLRLLSAIQNVEGSVISMHVGVAFEKDGKVYFFEKIDPSLPYRLSEFNSWKDLKEHLLTGRFQMFADQMAFLVNNQSIDELIK
ncbi:DUF4300 family protein [Tuanshanicoccus lijuaniae]|uniref:DUF4300 family protein n=1 Tax=Aerococcaceae bacterium zg-1292 TaxID=2774330 RepID=UPI0019351F35|nr:DUF4300 family protein [Aerococcaceae bacterium zg-1292]MBF6626112.1 DUF4300 family protein [Aerococcaceae bacterium zg-BR9]MBF6978798.1 DUF4300 family protein [Aerococcaceae bacterium zg-BR22]MBS4455233.1 DUF4300 family protein [Aerococcaceae bacterium zg-A91]MBS4457957.1 DUF4300 family protein [Aerococcaceae bacterium zg-BR33]